MKKKKLFSQKRTKRHGASVSRMPHKTPEPRQHTQQQWGKQGRAGFSWVLFPRLGDMAFSLGPHRVILRFCHHNKTSEVTNLKRERLSLLTQLSTFCSRTGWLHREAFISKICDWAKPLTSGKERKKSARAPQCPWEHTSNDLRILH